MVDHEGVPGDVQVECANPACCWQGDMREAVMPLGRPALCPLCREPVEAEYPSR